MRESLAEIAELTRGAGTRPMQTALPGVTVVRGEVPSHQLAAIYEPMVGFTVQGRKTLSIGETVIHAAGPAYYVIPIEVPATGLVHQAPGGLPYLSVGLRINRGLLLDVVKALPAEGREERVPEFASCPATPEFVDAWLRLLRLLRAPRDIPVLAPLCEREILYRVLVGPQGARLRRMSLLSARAPGIQQAVRWIRLNFDKPIDVAPIAVRWGMGVRTFHRQFKQVTGQSPIQFQKQLRLLEARRLLAFEGSAVSSAAYRVGYESPSQFSREYSRFFGAPPARDSARLRSLEGEAQRRGSRPRPRR